MTRHPPNGRSAADMQADADAIRDASPLVTLCLHCGDTFTGTAAEGREHAKEHRTKHHPHIRPAKRRQVSLHKFVNRDDGWRDLGVQRAAEVAALLAKRANEAA